jgi:hypothetical protein
MVLSVAIVFMSVVFAAVIATSSAHPYLRATARAWLALALGGIAVFLLVKFVQWAWSFSPAF